MQKHLKFAQFDVNFVHFVVKRMLLETSVNKLKLKLLRIGQLRFVLHCIEIIISINIAELGEIINNC